MTDLDRYLAHTSVVDSSPILVNSFSKKTVAACVSVRQRAAASGSQEYAKAEGCKRRAKTSCYKEDRSLNRGCRPSPSSWRICPPTIF